MAKRTSTEPPKPRRSKAAPGAPPPDTLGMEPDTLGAQPGVERPEPTEDDIRRRAHERYLERGGHHGTDFEDWIRAEEELKSRGSRASKPKSEG